MDKSQYLTTGELAKLVHVTKNTLFHYDKIGLFSPELVLENEYRYYSIHQLELLDAILMLKDLGMPLKDIKEFMEGRNPEKLLDLFEKEQKQIEMQMKKLKDQSSWLQKRGQKLKTCLEAETGEVFLQHQSVRYYVMSHIDKVTDTIFAEKITELTELYENRNYSIQYEIGYLQYDRDIRQGAYNNYQNVLLLMEHKPRGIPYKILSEGEYLTVYYKGHWRNIGEAYQKILFYAKEQNITLGEEYLEVYAMDLLAVEREEDYVTEISVKIK